MLILNNPIPTFGVVGGKGGTKGRRVVMVRSGREKEEEQEVIVV